MKVGLLINTFNRTDYLAQCMSSLRACDLTGVNVLIVDDCSTDRKVFDHFKGFMVYQMPSNQSIRFSLAKGLDTLFEQGCELVINLDSDAIVHPNFIPRLLDLHKRFPKDIITGFNTLVVGRHPIVEQHEDYCVKNTCGGINMLITKENYNLFVKRAIVTAQRTRGHWDDITCHVMKEHGRRIICTTPSAVQHIGFKSAMGHNANPDFAHDFKLPNTKKMLVMQPHGLGDVIFSQTLIRSLGDYEITWPVLPNFVDDCKRAYPHINFIPSHESPVDLELKRDAVVNGYRTIPIRWSNILLRVHYSRVMRAKYDMYRKDYRHWKEAAMWVRDEKKENELVKLLKLPKEYTLVNSFFGSDSQYKIDMPIDGVEMKSIPGYSLFDWAKVIEGAKEIHTVSTSLLYILDLLETGPVNVYVRKPIEQNHQNYKYIFDSSKFIYR